MNIDLNKDKLLLVKFVQYISLGLLIVTFIFVLLVKNVETNKNENLYKHYDNDNDNYIFIDKKGHTKFKLRTEKSMTIGEFREGRVFVGKKIKEIKNEEYENYYWYYILEFSILDNKGKLIKKVDKKAVSITEDSETSASYIPEFYKGYAVIHCVDENDINKKFIDYKNLHITDIYIDRDGNIEENVPNEIKEKLKDEILTYSRFEEDNDITFKRMKCNAYDEIGDCLGYVNRKGEIEIEPIFDAVYLESGNWYGRNPRFYNGIASVYLRDEYIDKENYSVLNGRYMFIDKQGKPINKETYYYAEPFYGDLAYVSNGEKSGYINRQGNWVWSKNKTLEHNNYTEVNDQYENNKNSLEEEKQKIIVKYNNIKFEKDKVLQALEEADQSFQEHITDKDEEGYYLYAGSASHRLYYMDYFEKNNPEVLEVYNILKNYCYIVEEYAASGIDACIDSLIKNHK